MVNQALLIGVASQTDPEDFAINFRPSTAARRAAQAQLTAYNKGDIEAFAAAYAEDIQLIDLETGSVFCSGKPGLIEKYRKLFEDNPSLHCDLLKRTSFGNMIYDEERVTGHPSGQIIHAMATYQVNEQGLITKAWFAKEIEIGA